MRNLALLLLALAACDAGGKKAPPPGTTPAPAPAASTPAISAPASVPEPIRREMERKWPEIEKRGEELLKLVQQSVDAANAGDRESFKRLSDEAMAVFADLNEDWSEIYYGAENAATEISEATADKVRDWLSPYDRKVKGWREKTIGLSKRMIK